MRKRVKESSNSTIKIHRDKEFSENPTERVDMEETITVEEDGIKDLEAVYSYCREKCAVDLQVVRIPIVEVRKMAELKLITPETLQNLIYEKFERLPDYPKT